MSTVPVYQADDPASLAAAVEASRTALVEYNASKAAEPLLLHTIAKSSTLIGIDEAVYRQVEAAIKSGKRHLMLYGPPGTGKTQLASEIAAQVSSNGFTLVTGSADWTSQDLIGGYQPIGDGKISFIPGIMLRSFDRPIIIDELNRCDIDKVLGPMFTVLSGHTTTLPYRVDVANRDSEQYQIFGTFQPGYAEPKYSPGPEWRILATINTIDKASLYQMSYALSRRFAWIFIDVPIDLNGFLFEFITKRKNKTLTGGNLPLGTILQSVNSIRPIGSAPFIDIINHCLVVDANFDFSAAPDTGTSQSYLDAFMINVMPMLDGILQDEIRKVADAVIEQLDLEPGTASRFKQQMISIGL
ncbi:MAG TPA: AAA family ATPase [Candidatus Tumulicola sp.]|jgi:RecA/RadA recombinase